MDGWIEYNADLFEAATVERMAGQLGSLLAAFPAGLDRLAADLPLLLREPGAGAPGRAATAGRVSRSRPNACTSCSRSRPRERPDAPAIAAGEERWTYRELERRANRLAHVLRALGVGPEVPVALCMAKTPRRMAALLGILKAGGAYVPLDPGYPGERLAFMLEERAAPLLLTESELLSALPERREGLLLLDGEWPGTPGQEAPGPPDGGDGATTSPT